jgi:hypothetical protein
VLGVFQYSGAMANRGLLVIVLAMSACYAEAGIGYYPVIHETVETSPGVTSTAKTSGYVGMVKLGFYLDVPLASLKSAVGVGLSPGVGGDGISPSKAPAKVGTSGVEGRLDVALPYFWSFLQPRLTAAYLGAMEATVDTAPNTGPVKTKASGHTVFLGGSIGGTKDGSLILLSAGLQQQSASTEAASTSDGAVGPTDVTAFGVAARLMVTWTPTGAFLKYYTPSKVSQQCGYGTPQCDASGHCESHYSCSN